MNIFRVLSYFFVLLLFCECKDDNMIDAEDDVAGVSMPAISWMQDPVIIEIPGVEESELMDYELPIEKYNNGETFVVDFLLSSDYINSAKVSIFLDNNEFALCKEDNDICVSTENIEYLIELVPYYDKGLNIDLDDQKVELSLILKRISGHKIRWGLVTPYNVYWSDIFIDDNLSLLKITTDHPVSDKIKFSTIRYGVFDESLFQHERAIKAIEVPNITEKPDLYLKYDNKKIPGVNNLVFNDIEGKVQKVELDGLVSYFLRRPLLTTNYNNTIFNSWNKAYMMKWVFDVTGDLRILDRMIEQSEILHKYRDDNYAKYKTLLRKEETDFIIGWSHFSDMCYFEGLPIKKKIGIATLGTGINFPASTALTIASHPEIWDNKIAGKSYRDVALDMLEYVFESWDYVIKQYYDDATGLLLSPSFAGEPEGYVPQWNRLFPLMAAGNVLVDTAEMLKLNDVRVKKIDSILLNLFKHFFDNSRIEPYNGKDIIYYPYGVYRLEANPNHTEDVIHMGFDCRGFSVFHYSGRYWNKHQTTLLSNLICYRMIKDENGTFTERQNSDRVIRGYNDWQGLPDLMWLAENEPELESKLLKYVVKLMEGNNTLDGRVVYYVLHYRALKYGIE